MMMRLGTSLLTAVGWVEVQERSNFPPWLLVQAVKMRGRERVAAGLRGARA
jgi:hypothetical protein